jgi:hypothetical protein
MADTELDAFLGGSEPAPEPQQAPPPEPPEQDAPDEDEGDAAEPDQGDDAPPEPRPGERTVPLAVLEKTRRDHKERAARLEGELAEVRRQFEEAKRVAQQPQQPQQPPPQQYIPDPAQDPAGYRAMLQEERQRDLVNERLNISQAAAMREHGAEAVTAATEEFRQAMAQNPALQAQLYQQVDPYAWVMQQAEALRLQREIGTDPKGWRERVIAEERAKWEAEYSGATPPAAPVSPAARLNPSLATARSAAPRSNGAWSGPTPLSDLFPNR